MNKELHPYQQRMVCEVQELDNRIANLEEFLTLHERIKAFAEGQ